MQRRREEREAVEEEEEAEPEEGGEKRRRRGWRSCGRNLLLPVLNCKIGCPFPFGWGKVVNSTPVNSSILYLRVPKFGTSVNSFTYIK